MLIKKIFYRFSNHYDIIGVDTSATFASIKSSYLQKSKLCHPDLFSNNEQAKNKYIELQQAYKNLISPTQRKKYDLSIGIKQSIWERDITNQINKRQLNNEIYEDLMKYEMKINQGVQSYEQKIKNKFNNQILILNQFGYLKNKRNMLTIFGVSIFWMVWNAIELILINYKGSQQNNYKLLNQKQSQVKLKIVPLVSR